MSESVPTPPVIPAGTPDLVAGRHALIAAVVAAGLVTVLVRINVTLPAVGHLGSALVAVLFLYLPVFAGHFRKEDLDDYGFHMRPLRQGLVTAGVAFAIIFPIFILGYYAFYELACNGSFLRHFVPRNMCGQYGGLSALHVPPMTWKLAEFMAVQLVVVALPEELFFRGFIHGLLERRFPPKRKILGGGLGLALVLSSVVFALIHLPKDGDPLALATFFPALLFGWMYSATRSILASTITHAGSNILVHLLDLIGRR